VVLGVLLPGLRLLGVVLPLPLRPDDERHGGSGEFSKILNSMSFEDLVVKSLLFPAFFFLLIAVSG
jgi:hypothetical protein